MRRCRLFASSSPKLSYLLNVVFCMCPQAYGRELAEAYDWLTKYRASRKEAELHQARTGRNCACL